MQGYANHGATESWTLIRAEGLHGCTSFASCIQMPNYMETSKQASANRRWTNLVSIYNLTVHARHNHIFIKQNRLTIA